MDNPVGALYTIHDIYNSVIHGDLNMKISYAHNPILPNDIFVPDVEAHVWEDGRIYLYGSFDLQGKRTYCSDRYHVYSSDNMIDWTDHGVSFTLADTDWAKDCGALYAPDCAFRNGIYYLYYCVPDGRCGVAKSDKPYGPFVDIGPIAHVHGIDPAVLIDDDVPSLQGPCDRSLKSEVPCGSCLNWR